MRTIVFALLLLPGTALAGGYAIPNENARELALAQATVAAQTSAEAVYQNPAALAGLRGGAVALSLQMIANQSSWSDPTLGSAETVNGPSYPPALFAAYGGELANGMGYGFGAGFHVIGGGSIEWPQDWAGSGRIESVSQTVYLAEASAGIEPLPGLRLGASLLYYRVTEEFTQEVSFVTSSSEATLGLAGDAFSYAFGAEYRLPWAPVTLGVDFRRQGKVDLSGSAHFEDVPPAFQTQLIDQDVASELTVPDELFLGAAWRATPQLLVMGSWSWERWTVYEEERFEGDKGFTVTVPRNFENAWVYRLGVEYEEPSFLPALTIRGGILRSISEQPATTVSPTLPDTSSWAPSVGFGYAILPSLRVDVGYQFAFFDELEAAGTEAFPGTYDTTVHLLSVGVDWRWGQSDT